MGFFLVMHMANKIDLHVECVGKNLFFTAICVEINTVHKPPVY